ncbi:MAG: hypothetical protein IKY83_00260 [Proteobacteria bacterium]|nr:hypothetical protein [Pseudomonadota bacterium]
MRTQLYSYEYDEITNIANWVIAKYVKSYPLDIYELMASIKTIKFRAYSDGEESFRTQCLKKSDTGFSFMCGCEMFVIYNDDVPRECILFSVLHELGHLAREHAVKRELFFDDLCARLDLDITGEEELVGQAKEEYEAFCTRQEREAHYFADVVAAPNWAIDFVAHKEPWDLCNTFGIGYTCAEIRLKSYRRWVNLGKPKVSPFEDFNAWSVPINKEGCM